VQVAAALRLTHAQTDALLVAAQLSDLQSLWQKIPGPADLALLAPWPLPQASKRYTASLLYQYAQALTEEMARLPAYFPRHIGVTFTAIYQDVRLRRVENLPPTEEQAIPPINEGEAWSALRHKSPRAVILGQPGMGKTWLFKAEALHLAQEAVEKARAGEDFVLPFWIRIPDLVALLGGKSSLQEIRRAIAELAARLTPTLPEQELVSALESFLEERPARAVLMLDALDEVPGRDGLRYAARRVVVQLGAATKSRILLASRTLGYTSAPLGRYLGADVMEYEVMPFTDREIMRVVRAWFHARIPLLRRIQVAMRRAPALVRQASNPLLLSLMCLINETHSEALSGNRSSLYEPVLRLLLEGHWRTFELQLPEARVRSKLRLLEAIAWCYATYRQSWWEQLPGDVIEREIERLPEAQRLWSTWRAEWGMVYEGPLWELSEWDGILIKGYGSTDGAASAVPYAFLHRTFQEFLVSRYLLHRFEEGGLDAPEIQEFMATKTTDPEWYIVLLLFVEQLTFTPLPDSDVLLARLSDLLLNSVQDRTGQMAVAATEILLNLHSTELGSEVVRSLRDRLLLMIGDTAAVKTLMRVQAGRLVAELGDPRAEVIGVDSVQFVHVPAGDFVMGSNPAFDPEAFAEESPQQLATTRPFAISRYPISYSQFRSFYEDGADGYTNPAYWPEAIALGHWQVGMVWRMRPQPRADGTVEWEATWAREPNLTGWPTDLPNVPILGISWYEARAFTRWLEKRWHDRGIIASSVHLDLPSETEWEKAARGADGRIYPWGNEFDGNRLNWIGHMLLAPTPIGAFPNSASPYGAEEMVGNLWEWTRSVFEPYGEGYSGADFARALTPETNLSIRGGAHFSIRTRCRCAARMSSRPNNRVNTTFRIVMVEEA
jgi:formylglycine-generating enzyme required for sulfatase activity